MIKEFRLFALLGIILPIFAFKILNTSWEINPNYDIKFSGRGASGTFTGLKGTVDFDPNALATSKIDVSVDAKSINTGNNKKNGHAQGESWFNTTQFPEIKFTSSSFVKQNEKYFVHGILEMHGVKKEMDIPFTFENNTFSGMFKINRKDFDIKGTGPSFMVGSEFEINLKIPVTKK